MSTLFKAALSGAHWQLLPRLFRQISARVGAESRRGLHLGVAFSSSERGDDGGGGAMDLDLSQMGLDSIRNFSIVAHVDHGKSTLADRILEHTGAVDKSSDNKQILDKLEVERERGITVKAQTASIVHKFQGRSYLLNLIDTPGHVDFSAEVARSLVASQGVVLLVDAKQGVQAQTVSNFYLAFASDLTVVPALNKIDLAGVDTDRVKAQMENLFEIEPSSVIHASAKTGAGVQEILDAVVERVPAPSQEFYGNKDDALRLLLQDSWYDKYRGAVLLVQVIEGTLRAGDTVTSALSGKHHTLRSLAILTPEETPVQELFPGQIGCFTCNMRAVNDAVVGDTFHLKDHPTKPVIADIVKPLPMVYAGFFPFDSADLSKMKGAVEKVALNDASVSVDVESSGAFGNGWRLGFLGVLHMEVFSQRLENEYGASVVVTTPSVPYKLVVKKENRAKLGEVVMVKNPNEWLENPYVEKYLEPMVRCTIMAPAEILNDVMAMCNDRRGRQVDVQFVDQNRVKMDYVMPLAEVITDFFPELKRRSSGYASLDYEDAGYAEGKLVKVELLLNDKPVAEMTTICHASKARARGKQLVERLKEILPRQLFDIKIQAAVGKKILARDDLKALRKNVTAKCYGGDMTRKMKLLKQQAEGKKKMRALGNIEISKDTFVSLLSSKS